MGWTEMQSGSKQGEQASAERQRLLGQAKDESLPIIQKEVGYGTGKEAIRPMQMVDFQAVKGPGLFEAEFGSKGSDIIFHVWPFGYHKADEDKKPLPRLPKGFEHLWDNALATGFAISRTETHYDADMGAWFTKANGMSENLFHRDLCIKIFEKLYALMGGI